MVMVKQFGIDGRYYDTNNYPYILINKTEDMVTGRFSNLEMAHKGRLMESLNNQNDILLLMNEQTGKFIDWRKKELFLFEKYKYNSDKYFKSIMSNKR